MNRAASRAGQPRPKTRRRSSLRHALRAIVIAGVERAMGWQVLFHTSKDELTEPRP